MIHCEEKLLKSIISDIKRYTSEHTDDVSFYRDITDLQGLSLQRISIKSDLEYFEEINKLLSVISTIIVHPYIVNARETLIVRAEQSYGLTPEMFHDTVLDQKLWKDKNGVMTPEEVYYFQNVDDLKNYENRFVVHLINLVSAQLADYVKFYDFLVGTLVQGNILTQDNSALDKAYDRLSTLAKKVKRIKATYFYREVSKANTRFTRIETTNVFIHNRAYNSCYRFYLRNVTYGDEEARANDMAVYYFTRLLLALRACSFQIDEEYARQTPLLALDDRIKKPAKNDAPKQENIVRPIRFTSENFNITLEGAHKYGGIFVTVEPKALKESKAKNLIVFDSTISFEEVEKNLGKYKKSGATAVDAVTLWDAAYVEDTIRSRNRGGVSENAMIMKYIEDKTRLIKASRQIYEAHCPACGGKDVRAIGENTYCCPACDTHYTFVDENIWFKKLRRV